MCIRDRGGHLLQALSRLVQLIGGVGDSGLHLGEMCIRDRDVDRALKSAESAAASMKDEYISVEHILLGLLDSANSALKELFRTYNVTREKVMQAPVSYTHLALCTVSPLCQVLAPVRTVPSLYWFPISKNGQQKFC